MLAAHGQITVGTSGARLSILIQNSGRAAALVTECAARNVPATVVDVEGPGAAVLVRTSRSPVLLPLARDWTRGAVKAVPDQLVVSAGFLRIWALAAGRMDDVGYLLGVDPHSPESTDGLTAACSRTGLAGAYIGVRGGGPGIRILGHRRLARLIDTVGTLPAGLPDECYPRESSPAGSLSPQQ